MEINNEVSEEITLQKSKPLGIILVQVLLIKSDKALMMFFKYLLIFICLIFSLINSSFLKATQVDSPRNNIDYLGLINKKDLTHSYFQKYLYNDRPPKVDIFKTMTGTTILVFQATYGGDGENESVLKIFEFKDKSYKLIFNKTMEGIEFITKGNLLKSINGKIILTLCECDWDTAEEEENFKIPLVFLIKEKILSSGLTKTEKTSILKRLEKQIKLNVIQQGGSKSSSYMSHVNKVRSRINFYLKDTIPYKTKEKSINVVCSYCKEAGNNFDTIIKNIKPRVHFLTNKKRLNSRIDIKVSASSHLKTKKNLNSYHPKNILDNNKNTAWVEGVDTDGVGEYLEFHFLNSRDIKSITITNGYAKNKKIFKANGRVKELEAILDNGTNTVKLSLKDSMKSQKLKVDFKKVRSIQLRIISVYKGRKYNDTAMSEVSFGTWRKHKIKEVELSNPKWVEVEKAYDNGGVGQTKKDKIESWNTFLAMVSLYEKNSREKNRFERIEQLESMKEYGKSELEKLNSSKRTKKKTVLSWPKCKFSPGGNDFHHGIKINDDLFLIQCGFDSKSEFSIEYVYKNKNKEVFIAYALDSYNTVYKVKSIQLTNARSKKKYKIECEKKSCGIKEIQCEIQVKKPNLKVLQDIRNIINKRDSDAAYEKRIFDTLGDMALAGNEEAGKLFLNYERWILTDGAHAEEYNMRVKDYNKSKTCKITVKKN